MGKPTGFKEIARKAIPYTDPLVRIGHWREFLEPVPAEHLSSQAARCMDCGVPFCQSGDGCPVENLIPEWNDLVYREDWHQAYLRLERTNNFPEFTGRVCPAPCEGACVLGITEPPVTIKNLENAIIDRAFAEGWVIPRPPAVRTGRRIAVVGSGPAGLAAATELNRQGHTVHVYERADRIGGLLMYGIPNMKLEKSTVERRLDLMRKEGIEFYPGVEIGKDMPLDTLRADYDAVLLAIGATKPRDLAIEGRQLKGIHFAMDYLTGVTQNLLDSGLLDSECSDGRTISAAGKRVLVIGGGDTGADCLGSAIRQGCTSTVNFELLNQPPEVRSPSNPWPQWPKVFRVDYSHSEAQAKFGKDPRCYSILTRRFLDNGHGEVGAVETVDLEWCEENGRTVMREIPNSERVWEVDLVFLALGFLGPEELVPKGLDVAQDARTNIVADEKSYTTSVPGVFAAGDCRRGQSLVVWAIREGRQAAASINRWLQHKVAEAA